VRLALLVFVVATLATTACGGRQRQISGTRIADTPANRTILDTIDAYRRAVESQDAEAILLMTSDRYWEDSGTPTGGDDYGRDRLREVLGTRFKQVTDVRFSMRYVSIRRACPGGSSSDVEPGCRAHVEVLIDASFSLQDARGAHRRLDKRDQNELILEWTCLKPDAAPGGAGGGGGDVCKWMFVGGM
jgi:hypothetical protein